MHLANNINLKKDNFTRNVCIGLVDGLTIPLAIAAALSSLIISSSSIIIACLVASVAGALTMTAGGYLEGRKYNAVENSKWPVITIGVGYFSGGIITVIPYLLSDNPLIALRYAAIICMIILFIAGYWESKLNGSNGWINAVRVCITAAIVAIAAFLVAKLFR